MSFVRFSKPGLTLRINQMIKILKSRIFEKHFIVLKYNLLFCERSSVRVSIVVSIPACHAGDRGSIPRHGELFLKITWFLLPFWHIRMHTRFLSNNIHVSHSYHLSNHVNNDLRFIWLRSQQCGLAFYGLTENQKALPCFANDCDRT